MNHQPMVYIVLVNWNGYNDSIECFESVLRLRYTNFRIVLCDNNSSDGSVEKIIEWAEGSYSYQPPNNTLAQFTTPPCAKPIKYRLFDSNWEHGFPLTQEKLVIINTGENLGFAGGNNVGIRFAIDQGNASYIWLLNNDTIVVQDTLEHLIERVRNNSEIGMVGATICYYHQPEIIQALGGARFNKYLAMSHLFGIKRRLNEIKEDEISSVESQLNWISGACMLMPIQFIKEIGPMEERYFLYFEELDWALRSTKKYKLAYAPKAKIYHKHGGTTHEGKQSNLSVYFKCRSRLKMYKKLLPEYTLFCLVATFKDLFLCIKNGKYSLIKPIWQAFSDEYIFCHKNNRRYI